jgi:hypothetical protein
LWDSWVSIETVRKEWKEVLASKDLDPVTYLSYSGC